MKNTTANTSFANEDFETLLTDKINTSCFDCGSSPASWASVNNSIYLCLNCAGNHRGFGVNVSYIRSITIDTWNETQIKYMKLGGNKRLIELMNLFEVPKSTPATVLYKSRLLDYHRNQIKSDVCEGKQLIPPRIEEALLPVEAQPGLNSESSSNSAPKSNKIYSVSSNAEDFEKTNSAPMGGFLSSMGSVFSSVLTKGKEVATNVNYSDLKNKIVSSGTKAVEVIKDTTIKGVELIKENTNYGVEVIKDQTSKGVEMLKDTSEKVMAKGYEVGGIMKEKGTELTNSDTYQSLKSKVGSSVNFMYGKFFTSNQTGQEQQYEDSSKSNPNSNSNEQKKD